MIFINTSKIYIILILITSLITLVIGFLSRASREHKPVDEFEEHLQPLPRRNDYTSYVLGPVCTPAEPIRHPSSVDEIISIVHEALVRNTTVKAFGAKHSVTDIICTNGIPINMRGIQGMQYHHENKTVTVGAGVLLHDLFLYLDSFGRALNTIPGFDLITVGGAIGTGAHGSTIKYKATISAQVVGLQIVDGLGQLRSISDEETLNAFRVHLGLLGIIISVTLETTPLYKVRVHNYVTSDDILTNGQAIDWAREMDQICFYWIPSYKSVVVANRTNLKGDPASIPGNAYTTVFKLTAPKPLFLFGQDIFEKAQAVNFKPLLHGILAWLAWSLFGKPPFISAHYTEDGHRSANPGTGIYHNVLASTCTAPTGPKYCPLLIGPPFVFDSEIVIDLKNLPGFVKDTQEGLRKSPAFFQFVMIFLRFSGPSTSYMSTSYGAETVHVEFAPFQRRNSYETSLAGLGAYQAMLQTLVKKYRGRSHWGKSGSYYHNKDALSMKTDGAAKHKFLTKMKEFDPHGIFLNDFGKRLQGVGTKLNTDPRTTHCALLDNCICAADTDCAPGQNCGKIGGYPVCLPKT